VNSHDVPELQASLELDPRLTFDSFVVGGANRLAAAAARRVAEQPGAAYNPLFLYSESGLGKTHLLMAIGHHIRKVHAEVSVIYDTIQHVMDAALTAIEEGDRDAFRLRLRGVSVLLLDDVQFLAGRRSAQEELLRAWDVLTARGGQVVLASDRPPTDIDNLDQRLLSRFSGGLIADLSLPDYETRVAIVRRKAEESGQTLASGVAENLARLAFTNVRELQGGLNRVLAVQELDARPVTADEVTRLLGGGEDQLRSDEFSSFVDEIAGTVGAVVARITPDQRIAEAIMRWEGEGFRTHVLEAALSRVATPDEADVLIAQYHAGVTRLKDISAAIRAIDASAGELARNDVLRNPDRLAEAETLLDQVRYRMQPLPASPAAPSFEELSLDAELLAVRAARAVALQPGARYNPLFIHAPAGTGRTALATALALLFRAQHGDAVAFMTGSQFAAEVIDALESNRVDSWRARYRRARLLVIDDVDELMNTERTQDELFHLFEAGRRAGVQIVLTSNAPPRELMGLEERLRTRFESGLVVGLLPDDAAESGAADVPELADQPATQEIDDWFLNREKVPLHWPYVQDLIQELD
jgi:chromosomal replication initiation ATPase DnaA